MMHPSTGSEIETAYTCVMSVTLPTSTPCNTQRR
jgi:hypothetical protein